MKKITTIVVALLFSMLTTQALAQTKESVSFNHIDLKQLKKSVVAQLRSDGLINHKKESIRLELRTNATFLNGKRLDEKLSNTYAELAEEFEIGRGSYRTIYITSECTAVGDFFEDSFRGKMEGRMRIQKVNGSSK